MSNNIELLQQSIAHYERMIDLAKKQNPTDFKSHNSMLTAIKEAWYGKNCVLCGAFYDDGCIECPIVKYATSCDETTSIWSRMNLATTWTGWLIYAMDMKELLEYIL